MIPEAVLAQIGTTLDDARGAVRQSDIGRGSGVELVALRSALRALIQAVEQLVEALVPATGESSDG